MTFNKIIAKIVHWVLLHLPSTSTSKSDQPVQLVKRSGHVIELHFAAGGGYFCGTRWRCVAATGPDVVAFTLSVKTAFNGNPIMYINTLSKCTAFPVVKSTHYTHTHTHTFSGSPSLPPHHFNYIIPFHTVIHVVKKVFEWVWARVCVKQKGAETEDGSSIIYSGIKVARVFTSAGVLPIWFLHFSNESVRHLWHSVPQCSRFPCPLKGRLVFPTVLRLSVVCDCNIKIVLFICRSEMRSSLLLTFCTCPENCRPAPTNVYYVIYY